MNELPCPLVKSPPKNKSISQDRLEDSTSSAQLPFNNVVLAKLVDLGLPPSEFGKTPTIKTQASLQRFTQNSPNGKNILELHS
jgi:hypothetical protein